MSEERQPWHRDSKISLAHLLSSLAMLTSIIGWGMTVENRLTSNEVMEANSIKSRETLRQHTIEKIESLKDQMTLNRAELREDLKEISDKLDRIMYLPPHAQTRNQS
ncbi:MAG: hypothetical protein HRT36_05465 [Alphaproteobacteria bacterium]|nr:hypothetical protein [Alphaproteobacteria bacterium]